MLEARTFVREIETTQKILEDHGAIFKGEYRSIDYIFESKDPSKSLRDEFLRLRVHLKNIWNEKDFIVSLKITEQRNIGKNSLIPVRKEFDSETEARKYIEDNFNDSFKYDFDFTRTGWQYDLGEDQIDLEKVENLNNCYTIEIKSHSEDGLIKLKYLLQITSLIQGPSVVEMKKLLSHF